MSYAKLDYVTSITQNGYTIKNNGTVTSSFYPSSFWSPAKIISADEVLEKETSTKIDLNSSTFHGLTKKLYQIKDLTTNTILSTTLTTLPVGTYEITYQFTYRDAENTLYFYDYTYTFTVLKNRLPIKKWTITDVINRCCETVEPLKLLEKPRFRLEGVEYNASGQVILPYTAGSQAEQLDKILSPEFVFTKMTLREMLQEIGGRIHGEPRVTSVDIINGKQYFTFKYDFYGQKTETRINRHRYVSASINHDVN